MEHNDRPHARPSAGPETAAVEGAKDPAERAEQDLAKAAKAYRRTEKAHEEARRELKRAAVGALAAGVRQTEVAKVTGWTREYLRRLRKGGDDG